MGWPPSGESKHTHIHTYTHKDIVDKHRNLLAPALSFWHYGWEAKPCMHAQGNNKASYSILAVCLQFPFQCSVSEETSTLVLAYPNTLINIQQLLEVTIALVNVKRMAYQTKFGLPLQKEIKFVWHLCSQPGGSDSTRWKRDVRKYPRLCT